MQATEALQRIAKLYSNEETIKTKGLTGEKKRQYRLEHSQPVVSHFFQWCRDQLECGGLLPSDPLTKALNYALNREASLNVFLEDPDVQPDTNHLERALRPIPLGRNYLHPIIMQGSLSYLGEDQWRRRFWLYRCYRTGHKNSVSYGLVPNHRSTPCPPIKPSQPFFATTG